MGQMKIQHDTITIRRNEYIIVKSPEIKFGRSPLHVHRASEVRSVDFGDGERNGLVDETDAVIFEIAANALSDVAIEAGAMIIRNGYK